VSKSTRKKSKRFNLTINKDFDRVVTGCQKQHGNRCWLYPPLVRAFKEINRRGKVDATVFENDGKILTGRVCPIRLYSIEIWDLEENLVAGELGYTVGSIYTSLTGFSSQDSAGSIQLCALGRLLSTLGFSLWDLGMEMDYKFSLGSKLMPRSTYLEHVWNVRESKGNLVLPTNLEPLNAKALIDQNVLQSDVKDTLENENTAERHFFVPNENRHIPIRGVQQPDKKRPKSF
jgi:Leu/Phe-tRNA-protein transferase